MKTRSLRCVYPLVALPAMLFLSGCGPTIEIKQNDNGNYVYDPAVVDMDASTNSTVTFEDKTNAAHTVEIRGPGATPTSPQVVLATGAVPANGTWSWTARKNTYAVGTRLSASEPAASSGPHSTEHGTLKFVP